MKTRHTLWLLFSLMLLLIGCSGGDSPALESAASDSAASESSTGTVALFLTDGPAEYDHIWIDISRVSLLADGQQTVVLDPAEPVTYDLLDLKVEGEDDAGALLALASVPAGLYDKIRLEVAPNSTGDCVVRAEKDGAPTDLTLPSGKIDLNPRGPFEVEPDGTLAITLDIDCDKSIHTNSNIFRPVVFVDIATVDEEQLSPRLLSGTITDIVYGDDDETVTGIELTLSNGTVRLPLRLNRQTVIWDEQDAPGDARNLRLNEAVTVRAALQDNGLTAVLVVIGTVEELNGIVTRAVMNNRFVIGGEYSIDCVPETMVLWGCDVELSPERIRAGMRVRVLARHREEAYRAIAVVLNNRIEGALSAIDDADNGYLLTITPVSDGDSPEPVMVFLPDTAPIRIKFDGALTIDQLRALIECKARDVLIPLDPTAGDLTATRLTVLPEQLKATITAIQLEQRLLTTDAGVVHVTTGARIIDTTGDETPPRRPVTDFTDLAVGDQLELYGIFPCDASAPFEAVVVLTVSPEQPE